MTRRSPLASWLKALAPTKKASRRKPRAASSAKPAPPRRRKAAAKSPKKSAGATVLNAVLGLGSPGARVAAGGPGGSGQWLDGLALLPLPGAVRRFRVYKPADVRAHERLPVLLLLHGCLQDADSFAASTRAHRLADRQRLLLLLPEQDRLANAQGCWNWFDTRHGRAQGEMALVLAALDQVLRLYPADPAQVAVAGLSAGASLAALLASRHPQRFAAVVMHSGVPPGLADSSLQALQAMRGRAARRLLAQLDADADADAAAEPDNAAGGGRRAPAADHPEPLGADEALADPAADAVALPPLLVIHGRADAVVAPDNGRAAAQLWAAACGAQPRPPRQVQRGQRHALTLTDHLAPGRRLCATLAEVHGMGHAWSGGDARWPFADAQGPDAWGLIWTFVRRALKARAPAVAPGRRRSATA